MVGSIKWTSQLIADPGSQGMQGEDGIQRRILHIRRWQAVSSHVSALGGGETQQRLVDPRNTVRISQDAELNDDVY